MSKTITMMRIPNYSLFRYLLMVCMVLFSGITNGQLTNDRIFNTTELTAKNVPGFNFMKDGRHFTRQTATTITKYDIVTGEPASLIFDANRLENPNFPKYFSGYAFSPNEDMLLIETAHERIYRRSSKANFWVYNLDNQKITPLFEGGKQMYATFNAQGNQVAFVHNNNLYVKDLASAKITQITTDGSWNKVINGALDWVYEEEFGFAQGFQWSPDGKAIAFYRFDESAVKEFTMTFFYDELYPDYQTFKYPKVGEENANVQVHIYHLESQQTVKVDLGTQTDQYVPRIKWTTNPNQLCVYRLNRLQNELDLLLADANSGQTTLMLKEKEDQYIDDMVFDNLTFLPDGNQFIWTSEKEGWHHIYLHHMITGESKALTSGAWDVTAFYGFDASRNRIYFQAAKQNPMNRAVYSVHLNGTNPQTIANEDGWNAATFSSTYDYYTLTHSTINQPPTYSVYSNGGRAVRVLEDNQQLADQLTKEGIAPAQFFSFRTEEGTTLNGFEIKPNNFQENIKYPVLMYVYGGPGSQTVVNRWGRDRDMWMRMLAQQGFVVVSVDNRGTGARGEAFKKVTYLELGKYETIDQIAAAKYLAQQSYIDPERISIFGWSYGGYMSSLCILKGSDVFHSAIAVAPVTNWKWYDTIYTERYMRTLANNASGYYDNAPIHFVDRLKGGYLLAHGIGDDNVHFQHTAEMANALIKAKKPFDTQFYPNRNHGIYGDFAKYHLFDKMTRFLQD